MTPATDQPGENKTGQFKQQRFYARCCAVQYLYQLDAQNAWDCSEEALELFWEQLRDTFSESPMPSLRQAWRYSCQLIRGVCDTHDQLDALICKAAQNWSLQRMGVVDRSILRLSAYEIVHVPQVSAVTAIDEAVELGKRFGQADSPRFINGVLDRIRKESAAPRS
ncbi:MAG: transcription antitermination factor NusB [Oligosphaeraceae bacterium]|nr:transcription antitermination factor NusB [Oligosphaeraceae bacterium]